MPGLMNFAAAQVLATLGAGAILFGSVLAMRQQRLKLLIAYSTIAQVGYLFFIFPLAAGAMASDPWSSFGWTGGWMQLFSHAFAKAAMFMAAGLIAETLGHDRIAEFGGIARVLPITTFGNRRPLADGRPAKRRIRCQMAAAPSNCYGRSVVVGRSDARRRTARGWLHPYGTRENTFRHGRTIKDVQDGDPQPRDCGADTCAVCGLAQSRSVAAIRISADRSTGNVSSGAVMNSVRFLAVRSNTLRERRL
jgi:hypothetical protein